MNLLRLFVPAAAWAVVVVSVVPPVNASDDDLALRQAIVDLHANAPAEGARFRPCDISREVRPGKTIVLHQRIL